MAGGRGRRDVHSSGTDHGSGRDHGSGTDHSSATDHSGARLALLAGALGLAAVGASWVAHDIRRAMGARLDERHADRMADSPRFHEGRFHNPWPATPVPPGATGRAARQMLRGGRARRPARDVPVHTPVLPTMAERDGLHVTWLGHSTALLEVEGARVLVDPVWGRRCSPSPLVGPARLHPVPLPLGALPRLDAILISHDHYDHLDAGTVRVLIRTQSAPFLVPLGVGAHLRAWGVPAGRVVELDWEQHRDEAGLRFTATAARHFSGRGPTRDRTLWSSWVVAGRHRRVFYSGDTGYFPQFADIGTRYGPFDVTLLQVGAYGVAWPDIHLLPEDAVQAHVDLDPDSRALLIPVHWGTFTLAPHPWGEPADRVWAEAKARGVRLAVPRPGERVDVDEPPPVDGWWQTLG